MLYNPSGDRIAESRNAVSQSIYPPRVAEKQKKFLSPHPNHCMIVVGEAGKPQACGVLYNNPKLLLKGMKLGPIGSFESANAEAAEALFAAAAIEATLLGYDALVGPMDGSTWNEYRLNTYDTIFGYPTEIWYPPIYNLYFSDAGFQVLDRYYSSLDTIDTTPFLAIVDGQPTLEELGIEMGGINKIEYSNELHLLCKFSNMAFANNVLFTPITSEAFAAKYGPAMAALPAWQVCIARKDGEIVGLMLAFDAPDHAGTIVLKSLARHPSAQYKHLGKYLTLHMMQEAQARGYSQVIRAYVRYENGYWDAEKYSLGKTQANYNLYWQPFTKVLA